MLQKQPLAETRHLHSSSEARDGLRWSWWAWQGISIDQSLFIYWLCYSVWGRWL